MELTAVIEKVDIVNQVVETGSFMDKGMGMLKSRISLLPQGQHAEYVIRVTKAGGFYNLSKRFSEFAQLHEELKARFGAALPMDLPSKTVIRHFDPNQLEDRKHALNCYLKELCRSREIASCAEVQRFFDQSGRAFAPDAGPRMGGASGAPGEPPPAAWAGPGGAPGPVRPSATSASGRVPAPVSSGTRHDPDDDLVGWDR
mmetsp:Transcript_100335/g.321733  ORF Transcript_100335/g.321733 Transcript_100335/m.321733 type:complete len:201 (+) Transcript_100335:99-701(+)